MKDYMNNEEYSEMIKIVDEEFIKAQKLDVSDCVDKTLELIRKLAKNLSENDCYDYHERMRKWFNKVGI